MTRPSEASVVPIRLTLDGRTGVSLWATPWEEDGEEWQAFLGAGSRVLLFGTAAELAEFLRSGEENDLTDHPRWADLLGLPAAELEPDEDYVFDLDGGVRPGGGRPRPVHGLRAVRPARPGAADRRGVRRRHAAEAGRADAGVRPAALRRRLVRRVRRRDAVDRGRRGGRAVLGAADRALLRAGRVAGRARRGRGRRGGGGATVAVVADEPTPEPAGPPAGTVVVGEVGEVTEVTEVTEPRTPPRTPRARRSSASGRSPASSRCR